MSFFNTVSDHWDKDKDEERVPLLLQLCRYKSLNITRWTMCQRVLNVNTAYIEIDTDTKMSGTRSVYFTFTPSYTVFMTTI